MALVYQYIFMKGSEVMALTDRQKYLIDLLHDMEFEADEILELISKLEDKENLEGVLKRIEAYKDKVNEDSRNAIREALGTKK